MAKVRPLSNYFAAVMSSGNIWPETVRYRARESRQALAEIFIGWRVDGKKIETQEQAMAYAKKRGTRIVRVNVVPVEVKP